MIPNYICLKDEQMVIIDGSIRKNLARLILSGIGANDFFNGSVSVDGADYTCELKTTLLVYRETFPDICGDMTSRIIDIVPVWCECITTTEKGFVANDFSWKEFREFLF